MQFTDIWPIRPLADPSSMVRGRQYRITVLTAQLLRLEYDPSGHFRDSATSLAVCRAFPPVPFRAEETESGLVLETSALRVEYDTRPFSSSGLTITLKGAYSVYQSVWHYGEVLKTFGGTARTLDEADGAVPVGDGLNSHVGYAVLDDSLSMDMDENGTLQPSVYAGTDLYFFGYGRDYAGCIRDYLHLSGAIPVLPRYALGNWWSRFYPYTQESYLALMDAFREHGVPLSVAVLDMNWHVTDIDPSFGSGWTGYTWDREKFPCPEKLLENLHCRGLHVTLNDHPADGIRPCEEAYASMARAMGDDPSDEKSYPYDASSPSWQAAFEQAVLRPLEEMGTDFWWIDWQQKGGSREARMDPLFTLNHTRFIHALSCGTSPLILSRYAGPGSHRYPVGFSGDTYATWASLAFQPYFTATSANIAYPWWSHDIGGHMHGTYDPELTVRWVQSGVFSPIMRLHSSDNPFMEKEPWKYPPEAQAIMTSFLRLRHRLVPWLYTQNVICSEQRTMFLRPVYFDDMDREAFRAQGQYFLGDGMLVAPVVSPLDALLRLAEVTVYLPRGSWTDLFTGRRYRGGRVLHMYRSLHTLPVLVPDGFILPMDADEVPRNGAPLPERLLIHVFPGKDSESILIEDNGRLPQDSSYTRVTTRMALSGNTFTLSLPEGEVSLIPPQRTYTVAVHGAVSPAPGTCPSGHFLAGTLSFPILPGQSITLPDPPDTDPDPVPWIRDILMHAHVPFDLKKAVQDTADRLGPVDYLAQLHTLSLPEALLGAILECYSAC